MRTILLNLAFLSFSLVLTAKNDTTSTFESCYAESVISESHQPMVEELTLELINGIWTADKNENTKVTTLQFNDFGLVGILTSGTSGIQNFNNQFWHLESFSDKTFLVFTDLDADHNQTYWVIRSCKGLSLTDISTGKKMELDYMPLNEAKLLKKTQKTLIGEWQCSIFPSEEMNAPNGFFAYRLRKDGSLVKSYGVTNATAITEKGYWQISPDGKYLILHLSEDGNIYTTQIAPINYLAYDELVLAPTMGITDLEQTLRTGQASFFFSKQSM